MSIHPNTLLMLILRPNGLSRKTLREILDETNTEAEEDIKINDREFHYIIMEDRYQKSYQISSEEGDIVIFDFVTYGYGDSIGWDKLEKLKNALEVWAIPICKKFNCEYEIKISANYW